jgi:hypothetical protein
MQEDILLISTNSPFVPDALKLSENSKPVNKITGLAKVIKKKK